MMTWWWWCWWWWWHHDGDANDVVVVDDDDEDAAADDDEDDAGAGAGALCSLHRALWSMCYALLIGQCVPEALHLLLRLQQEQQEADAISSSFSSSFLMGRREDQKEKVGQSRKRLDVYSTILCNIFKYIQHSYVIFMYIRMMSIHVCCIVSYSFMNKIRGLNPSCQTEATIQPSRFASIFAATCHLIVFFRVGDISAAPRIQDGRNTHGWFWKQTKKMTYT